MPSLIFKAISASLLAIGPMTVLALPAEAQERLPEGRALVAVPALDNGIHVNWRILNEGELGESFELFRDDVLIGSIAGHSSFHDPDGTDQSVYSLKRNGQLIAQAQVWASGFYAVALSKPEPRETPDGEIYEYTANDTAIADLDGDGLWDIVVKWDPVISRDNSQAGYSGEAIVDGYTLDGTLLWRIDLGRNIRAGAHYTQMVVADLDGDRRAEVMLKTADGTVDGTGQIIGDPTADWREASAIVRHNGGTGARTADDPATIDRLTGRILSGPEYITVFDGMTGAALASQPYLPSRGPSGDDNPSPAQMAAIWGDNYGNRSERYLAALAYVDGERPSAIFSRGYYGRSVISAWDWREGKLTSRWVFDSAELDDPNYSGQGNHQMSVADVDGDGRQEIIFGAMALDDDGTALWSSGLGHGDALHVGDLDPTNPGLERFGPHEDMANGNIGAAMLDAATGAILWSTPAERDTGRGAAFDLDPRYPGAEAWAVNDPRLFSSKGEPIADNRPASPNFGIWWDGDAQREILNGAQIFKWDWARSRMVEIFNATGLASNNGTKATPALSGDIFGDWREEVILRTEDSEYLVICTTPFPTTIGLPSLMLDRQYFVAVATQNSGYNQPPHPSFDLASQAQEE